MEEQTYSEIIKTAIENLSKTYKFENGLTLENAIMTYDMACECPDEFTMGAIIMACELGACIEDTGILADDESNKLYMFTVYESLKFAGIEDNETNDIMQEKMIATHEPYYPKCGHCFVSGMKYAIAMIGSIICEN